MFGTEIIEVGIGLAFAYFAISIICSGIVEAGVKITKLRSRHMKQALGELLDDKNYTGFVKELYEHHLITTPLNNRLGDPTSISSKNFALAVLDILGKNEKLSNAEQFKLIEARINTMKNEQMRKKMLAMLNSSAYQVDNMREKIEAWFDESMEAVTEWYRERMRFWVTLVSVVVVCAMNADTIKMTTMFWNDDELRTATVSAAEGYVKRYDARVASGMAPDLNVTTTIITDSSGTDTTTTQQTSSETDDSNLVRSIKTQLDTLYADINSAKVLPIGWHTEAIPCTSAYNGTQSPISWWLLKLAGLFLTVGAVSLGSTYWYKQLKSLLSLRLGAGQQTSSNTDNSSSAQNNGSKTANTPANKVNTPASPPQDEPVDESTDGSGGNAGDGGA